MIDTRYARYRTVEYTYFARNSSNPTAIHGTCWQDFGSWDITVRYNMFYDQFMVMYFSIP